MAGIKTCLELSGLLINGVMDFKTKQISLWVTAIYGAAGILWRVLSGTISWELFTSLVPGVVCLAAAWMTRERIGYGDGFLLLSAGCHFEWADMLLLCMLAVAAAGIFALILCIFFHKGKDYEMPFAPFLVVGYVVGRLFA